MKALKSPLLHAFLLSMLFALLFYKKDLGINLLIFEFFLAISLWTQDHRPAKSATGITVLIGVLLSGVFTVLIHSNLSYVIHFGVLILSSGVLLYAPAKSIHTHFNLGFLNVATAQIKACQHWYRGILGQSKIGALLYRRRVMLIPTFFVLVFIGIYRISNPIFDDVMARADFIFMDGLDHLFSSLDYLWISLFLLGSIIVNLFLFASPVEGIAEDDAKASISLMRSRKSNRYRNFKNLGLKTEYTMALVLFGMLNAVLLVVNVIDLNFVWLNFEWDGQYLKQFVHSGTYMLIFSILISIALVLYFFRKNLNFYKNNTTLRRLCYLWLAQNAFLALSVAMRNIWYINHYNLAYKRIGVFVFLMLTLYGIYSVYKKVANKRSAFYLYQSNAMATLIVLVISAGINWDALIAKYNVRHAGSAFFHLNYMAKLSDKTLPYLDLPLRKLHKIDRVQSHVFPSNNNYLTPGEYKDRINSRVGDFVNKWEHKSWLEWNYPESAAYNFFTAAQLR